MQREESHKILIGLVLFMLAFFLWAAYTAVENTEAAWKKRDSVVAAAIKAAEGN